MSGYFDQSARSIESRCVVILTCKLPSLNESWYFFIWWLWSVWLKWFVTFQTISKRRQSFQFCCHCWSRIEYNVLSSKICSVGIWFFSSIMYACDRFFHKIIPVGYYTWNSRIILRTEISMFAYYVLCMPFMSWICPTNIFNFIYTRERTPLIA